MAIVTFIVGVAVGAFLTWIVMRDTASRRPPRLVEFEDEGPSGQRASATPAAAARPRPSTGAEDDLTEIKGIGGVLAGKLNKLGITSFRQIAEFTKADIERINAELNFKGRIEREKWVQQAKAKLRK